ncbi:hypothetical protein N7509_001344 [Penicillium cosmopolitanum]|uniref:Uncharacterized protein n=1 Tax=Penicillium cosmopolitanum TaxID=1131564 RepID=A0A9W9WCE4_9EURO|nr:uncharacterized protein N7509_001344 [Penicillium cosmopolitanum]KAJ5414717.1 hypothetical protein N7509_001344 [Penicillium cosmopolitanum]
MATRILYDFFYKEKRTSTVDTRYKGLLTSATRIFNQAMTRLLIDNRANIMDKAPLRAAGRNGHHAIMKILI